MHTITLEKGLAAFLDRLGIPILRRPSRPQGPREKYIGNRA